MSTMAQCVTLNTRLLLQQRRFFIVGAAAFIFKYLQIAPIALKKNLVYSGMTCASRHRAMSRFFTDKSRQHFLFFQVLKMLALLRSVFCHIRFAKEWKRLPNRSHYNLGMRDNKSSLKRWSRMLSSVFCPKHDVQYLALCQLSYLKRCLSYDKIYTPVKNKAVTVSTLNGGHLVILSFIMAAFLCLRVDLHIVGQ